MSATELLGYAAISIMVASYAMEKAAPVFVAIFALGCAMAAVYAYLIASYPFVVAEGIWAAVATRRWLVARRSG